MIEINNFHSETFIINGKEYVKKIGEFWTSKQRQASSIHEVSYRACFKPQLPNYFITRYSNEGDTIYDPFGGRGTTVIEAALLKRNIIQNDINPISTIFARGRINPPTLNEVEDRLTQISYEDRNIKSEIDLSMFYEQDTLTEILNLKKYFQHKIQMEQMDNVDYWIQMVATNRLTGHSSGFFSVYTFPPNQAVSRESQLKINVKKNQTPTYRDTKKIILKKTKQLLNGLTKNEISNLKAISPKAQFLNSPANQTSMIPQDSVALVVTSPPFLDIVQYADDNWLRCWFNSIDTNLISSKITMSKTIEAWSTQMEHVLQELYRITKPGGHVAFEVGEIRNGKIKLDETILPIGLKVGFGCKEVIINSQNFTKTSNIWGVDNNEVGTNSNRIVLFTK